ncbi:M24 family metallopeptidase [Halovivax gelatinilyticus]|uniref:M24 family metallopeptidase n=1 Tax=Halovivax gelatinilyticus TaxID=2961597 RepID=UPI0020CA30A6|nr:M24 family metallopeptidase [Halovivax gelatinilyticus]
MRRAPEAIRRAIDERDAVAYVHVGPPTAPAGRYLIDQDGAGKQPTDTDHHAVAVLDERLHEPPGSTHAAERLATRLADRGRSGTLLVPATLPHDAALHLERGGFDLASSDALGRARAKKTDDEREEIRRAQQVAAAGVRRAATVLAPASDETREESTSEVDPALVSNGEPFAPENLRRRVDAAVVEGGGFPGGRTEIDAADPIALGEPVVCRLAPRTADGYHGRLTRTFVPGTDGGWERRAHVAVESALRSARTMLSAGPSTVREVEVELIAEVGSFGFADAARADVVGLGLEPRERPIDGATEIEPETVVSLEAGVEADAGASVVLGDVLAVDDGNADWLTRPTRSLDPVAHDE